MALIGCSEPTDGFLHSNMVVCRRLSITSRAQPGVLLRPRRGISCAAVFSPNGDGVSQAVLVGSGRAEAARSFTEPRSAGRQEDKRSSE